MIFIFTDILYIYIYIYAIRLFHGLYTGKGESELAVTGERKGVENGEEPPLENRGIEG